MIWHIFRKDAKLLWKLTLGIAILNFAAAATMVSMGHFVDGRRAEAANMFTMVAFLGGVFLIAAAVHHDAIPGVRLDWLIRPILRKDLLLAKVLFVLLMFQAPILLADILGTVADGFSLKRALTVAFSRSVYLLLMFDLPILAFASLTRNIMEAVFGTVVSLIAFVIATRLLRIEGAFGHAWGTATGWIAEVALLLVLLLGSAAILALQYFRRKTVLSRCLTGVVAVFGLLTAVIPWQPAFAIQRSLSHAPEAGNNVAIAFIPSAGRSIQRDLSGNDSYVNVNLPLQISGLPVESILQSDAIQVHLSASSQTINAGFAQLNVYSDSTDNATQSTRQSFSVPSDLYIRIKDQPVRLDIDYSLTMLQLSASHAFPIAGPGQRLPDVGWCGTRINGYQTAVELSCLQAGKSLGCVVSYLEHSSGRRNPPIYACRPDYAPYVAWQFGPDALTRTFRTFPFRDPSGLAKYPVDETHVKESQVVLKTFQPQAHFQRTLVLPEIRLSDWVGR